MWSQKEYLSSLIWFLIHTCFRFRETGERQGWGEGGHQHRLLTPYQSLPSSHGWGHSGPQDGIREPWAQCRLHHPPTPKLQPSCWSSKNKNSLACHQRCGSLKLKSCFEHIQFTSRLFFLFNRIAVRKEKYMLPRSPAVFKCTEL